MIHPSYSELMQVVNKDTDADEPPVVNSRYSIVLATSKRARQIIGGDTPLVPYVSGKKPLSVAIDELYQGKAFFSVFFPFFPHTFFPPAITLVR